MFSKHWWVKNSSSNSVKENNKGTSRFSVPNLPLKRNKSKLTRSDTPETTGGLAPMAEYQDLLGKLDKEENSDKFPTACVTGANLSLIGGSGAAGQTSPNLTQQAISIQKQSAEGLMSLMRTIGKAYVHLSSYECRMAVDAMELLPTNQKRTGWVLSHLAKAFFEMADYKRAAK